MKKDFVEKATAAERNWWKEHEALKKEYADLQPEWDESGWQFTPKALTKGEQLLEEGDQIILIAPHGTVREVLLWSEDSDIETVEMLYNRDFVSKEVYDLLQDYDEIVGWAMKFREQSHLLSEKHEAMMAGLALANGLAFEWEEGSKHFIDAKGEMVLDLWGMDSEEVGAE